MGEQKSEGEDCGKESISINSRNDPITRQCIGAIMNSRAFRRLRHSMQKKKKKKKKRLKSVVFGPAKSRN